MKLKYYLRGMAVGILLTTIILSIVNAGNKPLTDVEIRQRALALGMIDSDSIRLSSFQNGAQSSVPDEKDSITETIPADENQEDNSISEESSEAETVEQQDGNKPQDVAVTGSDGIDTVKSEEEIISDGEAVVIRITSGASSYTISKELAEAGLVEDASAFDDFLCNSGYSRKIRIGVYEIYPGTSEEDIAKIISRQR